MKKYLSLQKLEELTLADLSNNQGMSDMTSRFKKERNKIMGSETRATSFSDSKINDDGSVDFTFVSEATDKYPDDFKYKRTPQDKNYKFMKNPEKTYTMILRILDFDKWLTTYPDKTEITEKDIKDILDVSEIEIDSDIPSFYWQGNAHYLQQLGGTINKEPIKKPQFWNKPQYHGDGNGFLDKVTQSIINQVSFFRNLMASSLTKKLKQKGAI